MDEKSDNLPNFSQHVNECWNKDESLMKINQNGCDFLLCVLFLQAFVFLKKKAMNIQIEALQVSFENFTLKKQDTIEA
jgi:hypothetical protein